MLSRNQLRYRVNRGRVLPRFVDCSAPPLLQLAAGLLDTLNEGLGQRRAELDEALAAQLAASAPAVDGLVARGLLKLVQDRASFAPADPRVADARLQRLRRSAVLWRQLPATAALADYQRALDAEHGASARAQLYDDLAAARPLQAMRPLTPVQLLQRYNMAQVQGLLLASAAVTVSTECTDLLRVRRLLRWLKFCRLVAAVTYAAPRWQLQLSGPAAILAQSKKYGLQLALFVPAVPLLAPYRLEATVCLRPGSSWQLQLDETAPLVSPHGHALGHLPPELAALQSACAGEPWQVQPAAEPRHIGADDMCVPDFVCQHAQAPPVYVELFHGWHRGPLLRRLQQLQACPDAQLRLGVERKLLQRADVVQAVAAYGGESRLLAFNGYPSPRRLRALLAATG